MRSFKDNEQRSWPVSVTVSTIKRVRDRAKVNLLEILGGDLLQKLIQDPVILCDVLFAVCEPEASKVGVSDEAFGRAMAGDALDDGCKVLLESLADFFPSPLQRANLRRVLELTTRVLTQAHEKIEARFASGEIEMKIAAEVQKLETREETGAIEMPLVASDSCGNVPASSASTPAP